MPDARRHHISSAVVATKPGCLDAVLVALEHFDNLEVHGGREGQDRGGHRRT